MPDYKKIVRKKSRAEKPTTEAGRNKKSLGKLIFFFVFTGLIVALVFGMYFLLTEIFSFKIKKFSVIDQNGKKVANPQDYFRLDLIGDSNLLNFDLEKVVQDIQARHPELADVCIRKQFPHRLLITIKERDPIAIVALKDYCLVDAEGFILPFQFEFRDLPKIIGIHPRETKLYSKSDSLRLKRALELFEQLKEAKICPKYKISQIDIQKYRDVVFYLENGIEVKMGENDFAQKAILLKKILAELKESDTVPKYIDLRFDSPVVKP